jgi:hypothetical protein
MPFGEALEIRKRALLPMLVLALSCERPVESTTVSSIAVDGRANANPSIAARGEFIAVAWSAAGDSVMDVYSAVSETGGQTFSGPVRVNQVEGDARVNSEQPPRVALVPRGAANPEVIVVWTTRSAAGTRLLVGRSTDGGRTFAHTDTVPGSAGIASRGWQSIAVDSAGRVGVLWLDHRDVPPAASAHHHAPAPNAKPAGPKADPAERAALSKLYFATLEGVTATTITGGVCYCCKTSLAATRDGFVAAWRHVYPGSYRDIAFTASRDGGRIFSAPVRVSEDGWQIDGCPENGPAIAAGADSRVHVAWPAPADGKSASPHSLFYAVSGDGRSFSPRIRIPTAGPVAHVQLSIGHDGLPFVFWDEVVDGSRRVAAARATSSASSAFESVPLPAQPRGGGWPVLAATPSGLIVAWVNGAGVGNSIGVAKVK